MENMERFSKSFDAENMDRFSKSYATDFQVFIEETSKRPMPTDQNMYVSKILAQFWQTLSLFGQVV